MTDLVDRLRAALDRAEATARAASPGPWIVGTTSGYYGQNGEPASSSEIVITAQGNWPRHRTIRGSHIASKPTDGPARMICDVDYDHEGNADHIAANDPTHVLRTIAAHRRIVDRHERGVSHPDECGRCNDPYPCDDVRALASIYRMLIETERERPWRKGMAP